MVFLEQDPDGAPDGAGDNRRGERRNCAGGGAEAECLGSELGGMRESVLVGAGANAILGTSALALDGPSRRGGRGGAMNVGGSTSS